jgi:hypothetical protein
MIEKKKNIRFLGIDSEELTLFLRLQKKIEPI